MPLFSSLFGALMGIVGIVLNLYFWVVIVATLLTWVRPDPYNPIVRFLRAITEPVFYRVRRLMPFVMIGGFDLSPIVVLLLIQFVQMFLTYFTGAMIGRTMIMH
ncbi:hypothetical protein JCM15519_05370 [Fundidesulfovibrio butyratiphilus]